MTIQEVLQRFPNTTAEQWTQHKNGKGWVFYTAHADTTAFVEGIVSGNARVYGDARVSGNAWVSGNARVSGNAWVYDNALVYGDARVYGNALVYGDARVSGNAWVYDNALVYGDARVYGNALVYGDARVSGNALVSGNARVSGNAWDKSPLYIQGTKHALTLASYTEIAVGCHVHPIAYWKRHYKTIGRKEGYTLAQIKEYGEYIALFAKTAKRYRVKA